MNIQMKKKKEENTQNVKIVKHAEDVLWIFTILERGLFC